MSADEPRRPKLYFNPRTPCGVRPSALYATAIGGWHFNPRTPCGVRPRRALAQRPPSVFQSTHPVRGATVSRISGRFWIRFQSTHPVRGATVDVIQIVNVVVFQSTHPVRGATESLLPARSTVGISIHAPRAGCDTVHHCYPAGMYPISIHAPRAGCDRQPPQKRALCPNFNPRTPCGVRPCGLRGLTTRLLFQSTHPVRGATFETVYDFAYTEFQSTHPVRGATAARRLSRSNRRYFNPRTPCGVRRPRLFGRRKILLISIHAPRAGCDQIERAWSLCCAFQSTHPVRGATSDRGYAPIYARISIHAPRAGCDTVMEIATAIQQISIHAPRAGCDAQAVRDGKYKPIFQSTHPVRGAT